MAAIPAPVIIGMAIEPIMIIAPNPLMPKKIKAVAAVIRPAMAIGWSPESSAAFFMMVSDMPVFWITRANIEPNTTNTIGPLKRNDPFTTISPSHSKNGTPEIKAIHPAIRGSAKSVGKILATIRAAKRTNPPRSKIPDKVNVSTSIYFKNNREIKIFFKELSINKLQNLPSFSYQTFLSITDALKSLSWLPFCNWMSPPSIQPFANSFSPLTDMTKCVFRETNFLHYIHSLIKNSENFLKLLYATCQVLWQKYFLPYKKSFIGFFAVQKVLSENSINRVATPFVIFQPPKPAETNFYKKFIFQTSTKNFIKICKKKISTEDEKIFLLEKFF